MQQFPDINPGNRLSDLHREATEYRLAHSLKTGSRHGFRAAAARLLRRTADAIEPGQLRKNSITSA